MTTAITTTKPVSIMEQLKLPKVRERIEQALGKKANIEEFLSNTAIEIGKNPKLSECTWESVLQCAIDSANFGLIPNKQLGHAYLIPYENSYQSNGAWLKRMECQLQIGYKGYIKKFAEYGMNVEVELVTHQEIKDGRFEEVRGSKSYILHKPIRSGIRSEADIALAYAIGRCEGRHDIIAAMSIEEIKEAAKTKAYDKDERKMISKLKGAWTNGERETDFGEMCKKTIIRRLVKISDVDVVNRISSYEGERDGNFKEVIPKNNNTEIKQGILQSVSGYVPTSPAPRTPPYELMAANKEAEVSTDDKTGLDYNCRSLAMSLEEQRKLPLREASNEPLIDTTILTPLIPQ